MNPNIKKQKKNKIFMNPEKQFEVLINSYFSNSAYVNIDKYKSHELEVRFGTIGNKPITKIDYDNVIKKIKSLGFKSNNQEGNYLLRMSNEFLSEKVGSYKLSNIRTEINGLNAIKDYCSSNSIEKILQQMSYNVSFTKKSNITNEDNEMLGFATFNDFNFRVSYQIEEKLSKNSNICKEIIENWNNSKKNFRFLNRVTFTKDDIPINIDISIVKTSKKINNKYENTITIQESNIFNNYESYEIELEIDNKRIGPGTNFNTPILVMNVIKKTIKYILSGIQKSNYPISYKEQDEVLKNYMELIYKNDWKPNQRIYPKNFIGPSSYTLQIKNIVPISNSTNIPNIRNDFSVTEKADGERHLMYITNDGKIYFINTSMEVIFTGSKTKNKEYFNSLIDGELILNDKTGKYINLYASFDIYYLNNRDIRMYPFDSSEPIKDNNELLRYNLLLEMIKNIEPTSIISDDKISPINIKCKEFYSTNTNSGIDIFNACNNVIQKIKNNLFEYNTDGLIFTPMSLGVGSNKSNSAGPLKKITWDYSFKWKPSEYNTIDFLVSTQKNSSNQDITHPIFEDGTNTSLITQYSEYKTIVLRCGFDENKHGYINPCQDVLDNKLPIYKETSEYENTYKPVQFYPTNPYDPNAGVCNILLKKDDNGVFQMFTEENEVFYDNMIVEFKYDFMQPKGFNWIPLRIRYDKTSEYKKGLNNFGNDYNVANSNWHSIHNPITEEMITTGKNIPEEILDENIYYNRITKETNTQGLRDFHNLFVKKKLIYNTSKPGNILIDYACGKGGDFPKWIESKLSFVFGIDISKDNIENRLDGACARFLNFKKDFKEVPYALFVNGDSSKNIKNGDALFDVKSKQITNAVFNIGNINKDILGKGVIQQLGKGVNGFDISVCNFAIHYFFENIMTLNNFLKNISECTKLNGYFIGCSYDGKTIFNKLIKYKDGESISIYNENNKVWELVKNYSYDNFDDDQSCLGYKIAVYQESINRLITEYLVNYDYLNIIIESYGFRVITQEESNNIGLTNGSGMFNELYDLMVREISVNKNNIKTKIGKANDMKSYEKDISFLNRFFIYKKVREVDSEKIYKNFVNNYKSQTEINYDNEETKNAVDIANKSVKKTYIKKLNKKIVIIPDIEEIEKDYENLESEEEIKIVIKSKTNKQKQTTKTTKTKKSKI